MSKIAGILNITPDSFSDGGLYCSKQKALEHTEDMIAQGIDIIDIGAVATNCYASKITPEQELARMQDILPSVITLAHNARVEVSIDTFSPLVASFAIEHGIDYINDQCGGTSQILDLIVNTDVKLIFMHSLVVPVNKQIVLAEDIDLIETLYKWASDKINFFVIYGISTERLIFDPGIGFGKSAKQSWHIIKEVEAFKRLNIPLMIGHSRKSFLAEVFNNHREKDLQTAIVSMFLQHKNIDYIRVHNVALHKKLFSILF